MTQDPKAGSIQVWIRNHIAMYRRSETLWDGPLLLGQYGFGHSAQSRTIKEMQQRRHSSTKAMYECL